MALLNTPNEVGGLEFGHFEFRFWREEIGFLAKHQKITGLEEGFIPAPRSGFIQICSKNKSGDKSLFPTCDFLMLNMKF